MNRTTDTPALLSLLSGSQSSISIVTSRSVVNIIIQYSFVLLTSRMRKATPIIISSAMYSNIFFSLTAKYADTPKKHRYIKYAGCLPAYSVPAYNISRKCTHTWHATNAAIRAITERLKLLINLYKSGAMI